ncbi:hypothetical protein [Micromonospora musae]|uniref:hypothetical protein n=1 Tax=Micromonospora musae TaxID=1894970 RepID=UPI0011C43A43|nr:hypothetical protein [Micromonospora musae]
MTFPFHPDSAISVMNYSPPLNALHFRTLKGDEIGAELPEFGKEFSPKNGRPVIYLDQKDWSSLAKSIHAPEKVLPAAEREAAELLISLARAKKVILPLSAAHMAETCKWTNDEERYRLALTIVQLSAGWQMRDPLDIRRFEIRSALVARFKGETLDQPANITLEPHAKHGSRRSTRPPRQRRGFSPEIELAIDALTSVQGAIDTMLDAKPVPMLPTPAWVSKFQGFTDWLAGENRTSQRKRQSIDVFFIADSMREMAQAAAEAGVSPEEMSVWLKKFSNEDITLMPSLGLFREALHQKHLNPGTRWENNDLTDLMYLTCAAAYADYAVGENSLVSQLEQAQKRLGRPTNVYRRLRDLVPVLEKL